MSVAELGARTMSMGTVSAELLKLRKRPVWWILTTVQLAGVALFGYLLSYVFMLGGTDIPGVDVNEVLRGLLPASVLQTSLGLLTGFGGPIALILAALFVGSEFSWGTTKTMATQRPGRLELAAGKLTALAVALAALVAATLLVATASSLLIASLEGESMVLPAVGEMLRGAGTGWLILAAYAGLGALLATVFRGVGLAIGLGLVYYFVVETMLMTLPLPEWFSEVAVQALLTPNALALAASFGVTPMGPGMDPSAAPSAVQAASVLTAYIVGFTVIAVTVFRRRAIS